MTSPALALEFRSPEALLAAIEAAKRSGIVCLDALTPFPLPEVAEALQQGTDRIAWIAGLAALFGATSMAAVQWWAGHAYPLDIGGRPVLPWPAFVSTTIIVGILWAALGAFVGLLWLLQLPRLNHPTFEIPGIERIWDGRFYLLVEGDDLKDSLIASLHPAAVHRLAA